MTHSDFDVQKMLDLKNNFKMKDVIMRGKLVKKIVMLVLIIFSMIITISCGNQNQETGSNTGAGNVASSVSNTNVGTNASSNVSQVKMSVDQIEPVGEMVLIPAGKFIMGSNKVDEDGMQARYGFIKTPYLDEHPQQTVDLDAFYIDKNEVTNAHYKRFIRVAKRPDPIEWTQNGYNVYKEKLEAMNVKMLRQVAVDYFKLDMDTGKMNKAQLLRAMFDKQQFMDNLPASDVTWYDAYSYCAAAGKRLPSESEWEKAARGEKGQEFPWGETWDPSIANTGDDVEWEEGIAPVGSYEKSKSPYGAYDMAGNVWEWVQDWYQPYKDSNYTDKEFGEKNKVIRGGGGGIGHYSISLFFRGASRQFSGPNKASPDVGFRCAKSEELAVKN
ncbi:MAG: formylglycine-generating enzyme family protein [Gammaproteobacteria bacterium]|nr:formylglycine-generating enzyme family protein [Gammaproteobacteria bacterium]